MFGDQTGGYENFFPLTTCDCDFEWYFNLAAAIPSPLLKTAGFMCDGRALDSFPVVAIIVVDRIDQRPQGEVVVPAVDRAVSFNPLVIMEHSGQCVARRIPCEGQGAGSRLRSPGD
jgi:hypothetical protein